MFLFSIIFSFLFLVYVNVILGLFYIHSFYIHPKDFSTCQRVQEPWNMAKIMAKNLDNTAKNNEKNLENLEIVNKKLADTLNRYTISFNIFLIFCYEIYVFYNLSLFLFIQSHV